jgi:hypothetical protein
MSGFLAFEPRRRPAGTAEPPGVPETAAPALGALGGLGAGPWLCAGDDAGPLGPTNVAVEGGGAPAALCTTCSCHAFHRAPGDRCRCSACEPPVLPGQAAALDGWTFCHVPGGGVVLDRRGAPGPTCHQDTGPLGAAPNPPRPPNVSVALAPSLGALADLGASAPDSVGAGAGPAGWQGWPADEHRSALELPDPATAPLGRCRSCRFTAPVDADARCGACITRDGQPRAPEAAKAPNAPGSAREDRRDPANPSHSFKATLAHRLRWSALTVERPSVDERGRAWTSAPTGRWIGERMAQRRRVLLGQEGDADGRRPGVL